MKSDDQLYQDLVKLLGWHVPSFRIRDKKYSTFMKILSYCVWIFNREFMTRYTTAIGTTVYVPEAKRKNSIWRTLAHEWWHMHRLTKLGKFVHGFLYLFPQSLAPLALLSILGIWFSWALWFLVALVFLLPIPAYFRYREELDAYTVSIACYYWQYGPVPDDYIEHKAKHFYGSNYYFMWPFKATIIDKLKERRSLVMGGAFDSLPVFGDVKTVIKGGVNANK